MKKLPNRPVKEGRREDRVRVPVPAEGKTDGPKSSRLSAQAERTILTAPVDSHEQSKSFEQGVRLLQVKDFQRAKECFERAAHGPVREMAHSARLRALMCERRLARREPALETPEEHYNYAVALMNQRRWEEAETHLERAVAQNPRGDHLYYALALCRGWRGDLEGAYRYMKQAIELQPRNLLVARNDPDFAELSQRSPLAELLSPERTSLL